MAKFRKKPVEVEAVQFTGTNFPTICKFVGRVHDDESGMWGFLPCEMVGEVEAEVWDKLHDTWVGVKPGQWIIKGVKGEFYPCDDEVFVDTYEEVDNG